jgi:STE24 endopeptidase
MFPIFIGEKYMNIFTCLVLFFVVGVYLIETIADLLNLKNISNVIPQEFDFFF